MNFNTRCRQDPSGEYQLLNVHLEEKTVLDGLSARKIGLGKTANRGHLILRKAMEPEKRKAKKTAEQQEGNIYINFHLTLENPAVSAASDLSLRLSCTIMALDNGRPKLSKRVN